MTRGARRFVGFDADAVTLARRLLGQRLVRVIDGRRLAGTIVEVEAYLGAEDRAAHTYGGRRTARNASMYLEGGHAYVYFIYGMHYCMNVVCGAAGVGTAVFIRALEPTEGIEIMRSRRRAAPRERDLCSGPAKLAQALGIDRTLDGEDLRSSDRLFIEKVAVGERAPRRIGSGPRIGIAYAGEWALKPLRFYVRGNSHISH
jgi:DNA-3-methyladenine glycosylase